MNRIARILLGMIALVSTTAFAAEPKYSITPNFFEQNPDHQALGPCHGGVVIDKPGNIYVTTDTARGIVVFSPAGKFLRAVGPTRIHGLEIREENGVQYIYGARPSDHEVVKLKLDGDKLTGSISGRQNDTNIEDGKLSGDDISFKVTREINGNKMVMKYSGKIDGDSIKGKIESERDGQPTSRDWNAKRAAK